MNIEKYLNQLGKNSVEASSKIKSLKLEEKNPILSIKNYLKLKKNLSKDQINNIKVIDLRNFQKAIIEFK